MHEAMTFHEELRKSRDEVHKLRQDLKRKSQSHYSVESERNSLVEHVDRKEREADRYKEHNSVLLEELKRIENELMQMNKTELEHIEKEEAMLLDEIVIRDVSEEDAEKIKHAQDLIMKVLKGKTFRLHGHKPIFYNATKLQGDELTTGSNGDRIEELEELVYEENGSGKVERKMEASLPQYWVYQNEGKTHYSHMAMISPLPKKSLFNWIVCWQTAWRHEGTSDQHFRCSYSLDTRTWTSHLEVALRDHPSGGDGGSKGGCVWSPVLFLHQQVLYLFYSESEECMRPAREDGLGREVPARWSLGGSIKYVKSVDGIAWTKPTTILHQSDEDRGIPKVIANQPIVTSEGRWLLPWWQEVSGSAEATETCVTEGEAKAGVLISEDKGHTWRSSKTVAHPSTWLIEGTLVELEDKSILQLFRTVEGSMFSSKSMDGGETWSEAERFILPNPNSKFNLIKLDNGNLLVAYNHQSIDRRRINLRVGVSNDEGQNWYYGGSLQPDYIDQEAHWQRWHYPTCIQDKQEPNEVYVVYSCDFTDPENENRTIGGIRIANVQLDEIEFSEDHKIILDLQEAIDER